MGSNAVDAKPHPPLVLLAVLAFVFTAHAAFFLIMRSWYPEWEPDAIPRNGWYGIARNLAAGHGYSLGASLTYFSVPTLIPTASRGPVPVLFLAACIKLFANPYYPILVAAWLLSAGNALLIYAVTRRVTHNRRRAMVVALIAGLHLSEMYVNTTFSYCGEPLFMHLTGWAVYLTLIAAERGSPRWSAAAGLMLGLACLARPTVLFLPVAFFGVFWATQRRRALQLGLAACLAFAVMQVPWVARNQMVFGRPVLTSTMSGYGLYVAAVAARDKRIGLAGWEIDRAALWREIRDAVNASGTSVAAMNEVELDTFLGRKATEIIAAHRLTYVKNSAMSAIGIWYWLNSGRGLYLVQNGLYYALAIAGILVALRRRQWPVLSLLALPAYAVVVHMPFVPQYRYILPFTPYLFVFTGLGALWLADAVRRRAARLELIPVSD